MHNPIALLYNELIATDSSAGGLGQYTALIAWETRRDELRKQHTSAPGEAGDELPPLVPLRHVLALHSTAQHSTDHTKSSINNITTTNKPNRRRDRRIQHPHRSDLVRRGGGGGGGTDLVGVFGGDDERVERRGVRRHERAQLVQESVSRRRRHCAPLPQFPSTRNLCSLPPPPPNRWIFFSLFLGSRLAFLLRKKS